MKVIHTRNEHQIISNLPCKFGHFWRKYNFWNVWASLTPKRNVMWYEILGPSFFSAHCASFMSRWLILREGVVCISVVGKQNCSISGSFYELLPNFCNFVNSIWKKKTIQSLEFKRLQKFGLKNWKKLPKKTRKFNFFTHKLIFMDKKLFKKNLK